MSAEYERLRKLQKIADAALANLALDELLEKILARVCDVFAADTCAVLLVEGDVLVPRAAKGLEEEVGVGIEIPLGEGFAGHVAASREAVAIDDVAHADVVNPILHEKGLQVLLGAPLIVQDRVLGVIHVGRRGKRAFTAEDQVLIELAAERVALGLERALIHDELVRLDRLKRHFIAVASHELRTPAASLRGFAATLYERRGELEREQVDLLVQMLFEQSGRLVTLLDQLLDLSRLDADVIEIQPQRLRVRERLEQIVAAAAQGREQDVEIDVPEELEVTVDPDALEHIVANLVVNGLRYGAAPVEVCAMQRDRHFRVSVEDHGPGIAPAFASELFDRFSRDSMVEKAHGAGLGLSIARAYAQAHGGDLLYDPATAHGARFEFVLPVNE